jgi:hypothetical protein
VSVAVFDPVERGVKTTLIAQLAPTATEVPQVDVSENCDAFAPDSAMLVIGSATVPMLVSVTAWGALATFVCTSPNTSDVEDKL